MASRKILITGGTGSFGKHLSRELLSHGANIVFLVRAKSDKEANEKVQSILSNETDKSKVTVLAGDLSQHNLGLPITTYSDLTSHITHIIHAAASTKFSLSIEEARKSNVDTTQAVLQFARDCKQLIRFGYISTAFVAGRRKGRILEDELLHNAGFLNNYEQTKYEAELAVRSCMKQLPILIMRPSLILTGSQKRSIMPFNALQLGIFLAKRGYLPILPGNENSFLDIIGPKTTSQAIISLLLKDNLSHSSYHITAGDKAIKVKNLITSIEKEHKITLSLKFCGDMRSFLIERDKATRLRPDLAIFYKKTETFLPELAYSKIFDTTHLENDVGQLDISEAMTTLKTFTE